MGAMKMLAGGAVGGLIGATIWAAIGYFTGYEVGWIAWGIGFLAGLGVRIVGSQNVARYDRVQRRMVVESAAADGPLAGAIAAAAAVVAVLVGKYAVVHLLVSAPANLAEYLDDETMISILADEIAAEREMEGKPVQWPAGVDPEEAYLQSDYPPELWSQAKGRWDQMSAEERDERKSLQATAFGEVVATTEGLAGAVLLGSFGVFDLLWFGLAAVTAFRVGASSAA